MVVPLCVFYVFERITSEGTTLKVYAATVFFTQRGDRLTKTDRDRQRHRFISKRWGGIDLLGLINR